MSTTLHNPGPRSRVRLVAVAVLATVWASACGSTVPLAERQQLLRDRGDLAFEDPLDPALPVPQAGVDTAGDGTVTPGVSAPSGAGPGSGQPVAPARTAPGSTPAAPTQTEVRVGMAYLRDPGTANQAAGFAGIGQIDQKRALDAMVELVNRNPPHGRKVVPVFYSYSTNDVQTKGAEQLSQEMCTHWTRDDRVFMVWGAGTDTLQACLTRAGVAQVGSGAGLSYAKTFQDNPWYVEHNGTALDRMAKDQIDQLVARGFFATCKRDPSTEPCVDGRPRIGLIRYDTPAHKAAGEMMRRTLAAHGLQLCNGCEFEVSYSSDNVATQLADAIEVNSAINSCRTPRSVPGTDTPPGPCTHMLFLGSIAGARIPLFYVQRAEDQQYRAKLGFNTQDAPMAVRNFYAGQGQTGYFAQFRESMLVSGRPADLSLEPAGHAECKAIFEAAGETFGGSDDSAGNKENQIGGFCDTAWYHLAALQAAGPDLTLDTFLRGVADAGTVRSATTFLMRTTGQRRDGAGAVRIGEWFDDCNCIRSVTGDIPV